MFSPVIKKFQRIQIQTQYRDECWSIDLIDRSSLAKYNKNYKFIFAMFHNYTKYAWAIPPKGKFGKNTTNALKNPNKKAKRKPDKIWSDRGKEVYNKIFLHYLRAKQSNSSTNSDLQAIFVERFNITLLDLINEPMYFEGKTCWLNHLDAALEKYNNRVHGTTKMTPFEMSNNRKLIPSLTPSSDNKYPKVQVGDFVRVPDKRNLYSKS